MAAAPDIAPDDPAALDRARAAWARALLATRVFAVDPQGLGGLMLRARAGPVRSIWLAGLEAVAPMRRLPPDIADDRLLGGLDLAATLKAGRPVQSTGLLEEARTANAILTLPMAERCSAALSGRLAQAMDQGGLAVLALDEGAEADERAPDALADRAALWVDIEGIPFGIAQANDTADAVEAIAKARKRLAMIRHHQTAIEALTGAAAALGVRSLRAPLLALRTARALAALDATDVVADRHLDLAAALVLAPRATQIPPADADPPQEQPPEPPDTTQDNPEDANKDRGDRPLEDQVLDAAKAVLPAELFAGPSGRTRSQSPRGGAGAKRTTPSHGRPAGSRPGKPDGRHRLDVLATLRQAAPWQGLRRSAAPDRTGIHVAPDDFRVKRYVRPAESVLIFVVDASGSAAAARLAEAKGAVELMLAEAYRRREKVALIAFRAAGADLLLPPTRALVAAKRQLAVLPGGGGTPLASGLLAGLSLARQVRRDGATPYLLVLTDGRGNIGLDGQPGRAQAAVDAETAAKAIAVEALDTVLIDTANRPQKAAEALARHMAGRYLPLPRADAAGLSRAIRAATQGAPT